MANKTVLVTIPSFNGESGYTLILQAQGSGTIANGSGDTLTPGSNGLFTATVTEAITGWFDVSVRDGSNVIWQGGKLYISADAEGNYIVDDMSNTSVSVWTYASRSLTTFGTLVSDIVTAIQSYLYGSGARTVTITVNDGTTALQNARVRLTSGATSHARDTNVSGVAVFNVDDATWTVSITRSGYTFAGASLVVDGTETATYSMTAITISEPAEPGLCTVRFEVRDADGTTLVQGASVKAVLDPNNAVSGILLSNAVHSGTTNSSGICDLVLVQGKSIIRGNKLYTITVTDPGSTTSEPLMKITGVVPNQTTAYASELIPRNM
jgi:hypothetical protein